MFSGWQAVCELNLSEHVPVDVWSRGWGLCSGWHLGPGFNSTSTPVRAGQARRDLLGASEARVPLSTAFADRQARFDPDLMHAGHPPFLQEQARRDNKPHYHGQRSLNLAPAAALQTNDTARAHLDRGRPAGKAAGDGAAAAPGGRSLRRWWSAGSTRRKLHRRSQSIPDSLTQLEHGGAGSRAQSETSGPGRPPQSGSQPDLPPAAERASRQQARSEGGLEAQAPAARSSQQPASEQVPAAGDKQQHGSLGTMRADSELVLSAGDGQQRGSLRRMRAASETALSVGDRSRAAAGANVP